MENKEIDPNVWRQNIKFLEKLEYNPIKDIDEHESITPTTNKGHLTLDSRKMFFQKVSKELESLKTKNNEENFYEVFKGQFGNKKDLDNFLEYQEKTLKNFTSDEIFIKNTNTKIVKIAKY